MVLETLESGAQAGVFFGVLTMLVVLVIGLGRSSKDVVELSPHGDAGPLVDQWALAEGWVRDDHQAARCYRRKSALGKSNMYVLLEQDDRGQRLVAYNAVTAPLTKRTLALSSPSWIGRLPRQRVLREFDNLLGALGVSPNARVLVSS